MAVVVYPDTEKALSGALQSLLDGRTEPVAENVRVSTIKPSSEVVPYPPKTVVIRSDGGVDLDHVRRLDRVGINIWCPTYAEANDLARLVAALMRDVTGPDFKNVRVVLHPVRIDELGTEEHRYLSVELVVKGSTL